MSLTRHFLLFLFVEEILSSSTATWFSKQGGKLAYATFNTTLVGEVTFKLYGDDDVFQDTVPLYGSTKSLRYPKAGTRNPAVDLKIVDLKTLDEIRVIPPASISSE